MPPHISAARAVQAHQQPITKGSDVCRRADDHESQNGRGADDTLATVASKMWDGNCGAIPVVDPDGIPLAMITDRDVCMASWSRACAPDRIRVAEVMSPRVAVCRASDTVEIAQSAMRMAQVRRLPVVDEQGHIVGVISLADMARAHEHADRQRRQRDAEGLAETLASICQRTSTSNQAEVTNATAAA